MILKIVPLHIQKDILHKMGFKAKKDWRKLLIINFYRNITHHYNPLIENTINFSKKEFITFFNFLKIIKVKTPEIINEIRLFLENKNFQKEFNLSKEEIWTHFNIGFIFKKN